MEVIKEVIRPGTYWYEDQNTGLPRKLTVTEDGIQHLFSQGKKMLQAQLSIPVPCEHQPDARPLTAAERAANTLKNNAGWVKDFSIQGDRLMATLSIEDPDVAKKLPHTIKWTSPWLNSFMDGDGTRWDGVVSHVALTTRPRIKQQSPFPNVAAAMSFAGLLRNPAFEPDIVPEGVGFELSRCGLMVTDGEGGLKPLFPTAFSLYTGAKLAAAPPKEKSKTPKPPPLADEQDDDPAPTGDDDPMMDEPGDGLDDDPLGGGMDDDPLAGLDDELGGGALDDPLAGPLDPLMDPAGGMGGEEDLPIYQVISDLLEAVGIPLGGPVTEMNFKQMLYDAVMQQIKSKVMTNDAAAAMDQGADDMASQPPAGGAPSNPVIQEQPPMYMSLEQVKKIKDPVQRKNMSVLLALQNNAMNSARESRRKRIDRIARILGKEKGDAFRAKMDAQSKGVQLSLSAEGIVHDPMAGVLDIVEAGLQDLPAMLSRDSHDFHQENHPEEYQGSSAISEDRRKEVANLLAQNLG